MAISLDAWKGVSDTSNDTCESPNSFVNSSNLPHGRHTCDWKISMAVFTVLSVLGFAAAILMKDRAVQVYISSGVLFSAGILIAGGLVHLLQDAQESFVEDLDIQNFGWSYAICGLTVVSLACVELLVGGVAAHMQNRKSDSVELTTTQPNDSPNCLIPEGEEENQQSSQPQELKEQKVVEADPELMILDDQLDPWVAIILTIALSVHSILEAIGIGASDDLSTFESNFLAISVHKFFTAYALANSLVCSGFWRKGYRTGFYIQAGIFIGITLLGIGIGWAVASAASENVASAILVSITAGSFLFVGAMEVAPTEMDTIRHEKVNPTLPIISFLTGYGVMTLLGKWV